MSPLVLEQEAIQKSLNGFFKPRTIAVIGASTSPEKIGHQIMRNIIDGGYTGELYPVHPSAGEILGKTAYPAVTDIPAEVDLAVIAIPASKVLAAFEQCAEKGVRCVSVITSGFAETGNAEPEKKIKELADKNGMAVLGPNMFGVVYEPNNLNASFGPQVSLPGKIAFVSQSGALGISLMGWTEMERIGIASLVSVGNKCDIGEKELIEYFNDDPNVEVILIYMEGLKNARQFMTTEIKKPVVVLKVGRSARGAKAAASHTGSLAGSDKVYDGAFRQLGVLRAGTFTEAFGWARTLSQPQPQGENILVITNGGGIGVRTTDECEKIGLPLFEDHQWLEEKFRSTMPSFGSTANPVDITGEADSRAYGRALKIALTEERIDSVILLYCETSVADPQETARTIEACYRESGARKPLVVGMVGGERTREAILYLNERRIPAFTAINEAVSALDALYNWKRTSSQAHDTIMLDKLPDEALNIIASARSAGRQVLMEHESRRIFELCGVYTPKAAFAANMDEAVEKARGLYPLAMKIASPDIVHKTDVDGVLLNIRSEEQLIMRYYHMMRHIREVRPEARISGVNLVQMIKGIECIVGINNDQQFGPTVMFGLGGVFVEALKDVSFRVIPFGKKEAEQLIGEIKGQEILKGFRGHTAHVSSIIDVLLSVQKLAPHVREIDINPLITNQDGSWAADARIVI